MGACKALAGGVQHCLIELEPDGARWMSGAPQSDAEGHDSYTAGLAACKLYDLACHLWQALSLRPHLEQRLNG